MRIAIVGAQCTGKSTLLKEIKEQQIFPDNYVFKEEVVRSLVRKSNIKINKEVDFESQLLIFEAHYWNVFNNKDLVTDRSCIDAWVYTQYNNKKNSFLEAEMADFKKLFINTLSYYDKIFYLPIEFELKSDGFRSLDPDFRVEIDKLFAQVLDEYQINFVSLGGSIKDRINLFKKHLYEEEQEHN